MDGLRQLRCGWCGPRAAAGPAAALGDRLGTNGRRFRRPFTSGRMGFRAGIQPPGGWLKTCRRTPKSPPACKPPTTPRGTGWFLALVIFLDFDHWTLDFSILPPAAFAIGPSPPNRSLITHHSSRVTVSVFQHLPWGGRAATNPVHTPRLYFAPNPAGPLTSPGIGIK
jgi:hypothetical protein